MIEIGTLMALAALLFVKHLIADGPLQTDYQVANKGRWLHPAGFAHSGTHVAFTAGTLGIWSLLFAVPLSLGFLAVVLLAEFVVHYVIDWLKCQVDARSGWASRVTTEDGRTVLQINDKFFFFAFLTDQMLHSLTYVAMLYAVGLG